MFKPGGYLITTEPDGRTVEEDTYTCGHCNRIVPVPPKCDAADLGGRCTCCDSLICKYCVGKGCRPMEEHLLRVEAGKVLFGAFHSEE